MMTIQSLLNPTVSDTRRYSNTTNDTSVQSKSAYSPASSALQYSPKPPTSTTVPAINRTQKHIGMSPLAVDHTGDAVNYPPHELHDQAICLRKDDVNELYRQHQLFKIKPSTTDGSGLIGENTRYIPYASEKKNFLTKTGRNGFNVFYYSFEVPGDREAKTHTVMWDYENGLVRITPFFKACQYSKTTPAKALSSTPGLKDLAHSITGGALAAQGYWLPYECARAVCLTFAYKIRWPLVHIFGPSFVRECLPPSHKDFGKFGISREIVRCAQLVADGWTASPKGTPEPGEIPRSVPHTDAQPEKKMLRPRPAVPMFREGSPFDSDGDSSVEFRGYRIATPSLETLSPKSSPQTGKWTPINPPNTPTSQQTASPTTNCLADSLLTPPPFASWRNDESAGEQLRSTTKMPTGAHDKHRTHKRRRSSTISPQHEDDDDFVPAEEETMSFADISEDSESDDEDIPLPPNKGHKRPRYHSNKTNDRKGDSSKSASPMLTSVMKKSTSHQKSKVSKKFTAEDVRAARILLDMSDEPDDLMVGLDEVVRRPALENS